MPRHHARAGGQEGLVDPAELRSSDLAGEHLYLVPKDDDLDLQFAIPTRMTAPDHAAEQRVEEGEQHDRRCYIGAGQGDESEKTYPSGEAGDTKDHIFPRGLFPPPLPEDMLTAPACVDCQQRLQPDEEYFRRFAAAGSYADAKAKELWDGKIVRSFDNSPAFQASLAKAINTMEWKTAGGIIVGNVVGLEGDQARIGHVLRKMVRGLSSIETSDVMPFDVKFNYSQVSPMTESLPDEVMDIVHATPLRTVGDVVRYKFTQPPGDPRMTISWFAFYRHAMFAVWTWPEEVNLPLPESNES